MTESQNKIIEEIKKIADIVAERKIIIAEELIRIESMLDDVFDIRNEPQYFKRLIN